MYHRILSYGIRPIRQFHRTSYNLKTEKYVIAPAKLSTDPLENERRFQHLGEKLQEIYIQTDASLRIKGSKFTQIQTQAIKNGVMYPTVSRVNQLPNVMSEAELVDFLEKNLINKSLPYPDYTKLYDRLPVFGRNAKLPELTIGKNEKSALNWYVQKLTKYSYKRNARMELKVIEILDLLLHNKSSQFSTATFDCMLRFYSFRYMFDKISDVLELMVKYNRPINTRTFNLILFESMKTGSRYRIKRTVRLLRDLLNGSTKPDTYTANVLLSGLKDNDQYMRLLAIMDHHRIPLYFTKNFCTRFGFKEPLTFEQLDDSADVIVANLALHERLTSKELSSVAAYEEFWAFCIENGLTPNSTSFELIFSDIVTKYESFTYASAFYHYFLEQFWTSSDANNGDVIPDSKEIYARILKTLIRIGSSTKKDKSPNWEKTVKYVYMKTINGKTGKSEASSETIENLKLVAMKRGIFNFNIQNYPTLKEMKEVESNFTRLQWMGTKPIWSFKENNLLFKQACYYFGWGYDLEQKPIHNESTIKGKSTYAPSKQLQKFGEKVEDSKGFIDNGEFDTWISDYYRHK